MKACRFCAEQIADTALKCPRCHAFQNDSGEPRRFDTANLVIAFVGSVAVIVTIGAGIFGYLGFSSIREITAKAIEIESASEKKVEQASEDFRRVTKESQFRLNALVLLQEHDQFQQVFDSIELDDVNSDRANQMLNQLRVAVEEVNKLEPVKDEEGYRSEMKAVLASLQAYRDALNENSSMLFKKAEEEVLGLSEENLSRNRICAGIYSHLCALTVKQNVQDANNFLAKQKHCAQKYYQSSLYLNRSVMIGANNLASALILSGTPDELTRAKAILEQIAKTFPSESIIEYNLAGYFARTKDYVRTMHHLERAKELGDLSSNQQIEFFKPIRCSRNFSMPAPLRCPSSRNDLRGCFGSRDDSLVRQACPLYAPLPRHTTRYGSQPTAR